MKILKAFQLFVGAMLFDRAIGKEKWVNEVDPVTKKFIPTFGLRFECDHGVVLPAVLKAETMSKLATHFGLEIKPGVDYERGRSKQDYDADEDKGITACSWHWYNPCTEPFTLPG